MHRSWQTQAVLLAWSALSFCFRSFRSMPLTLYSLWTKRCSRSLHLTIGRRKSLADCGNFCRRSLAFSSVRAMRGPATAWPPVNCACVPQLFEQLISTMLCPTFLRSEEIHLLTSLLCTHSNANFLSKSCLRHWIPCWLLTNTAVTYAVTNFWSHKLIVKVNK